MVSKRAKLVILKASTALISLTLAIEAPVAAQPAPEVAVTETLFRNVRIFDGQNARLSAPTDVLVRGNTIAVIGPATAAPGARIIDGGGRTLMPGLIDNHWHSASAAVGLQDALTGDPAYLALVAAKTNAETLMRGFTSVRDIGGTIFGLKRAIDAGITPGPRIWPSGAIISQTGGHGDYRMPGDFPASANRALHATEAAGAAIIADSPDEVRKRSRELLALGASQLKMAAGGGVSSNYDPLDVTQYTEAEFRAAVEAAENWGTYVTVHAYTPKAVQTALAAGVKCIEHGQLIDEATAQLIAKQGAWLSLQPFLDDEDAIPQAPKNRAKQVEMMRGTDVAYALAKKYHIKTAWGTDVLFDARLATRQGAMLTKLTRWYTPAEILKMATADNAELLALSGKRSPYQGKLGVVQVGALADLLLVNGDPIANIKLVEDPTKNFVVIMKDGQIFKDSVGQ
jgi:imidazolonepropionase-like amidohydrolase